MSSPVSDAPPATARRDFDRAYAAVVRRRNLFAARAAFFFALIVVTGILDMATTVREDRSFPVGASPRLVIRDEVGGGLRGGIEMRAGGSDRVRVEGKVHGTWRVRYVLEQRGDDVVIEVQPRPLLGWLSLLGPARFAVTAPTDTRVDIESCSAPLQIEGIIGGGSLRTTNGAIRLDGAGGHLSAATTNGAIAATGFAGTAKLQTSNGGIDVQGSRGTFDLTTTNGAVVLDAELRSGEHHRAVTTNGAVTVRLRGEPSLRVDARTTNGAVVVNRPIVTSARSGNALTGTIGAGEGALMVRTTNGEIAIE